MASEAPTTPILPTPDLIAQNLETIEQRIEDGSAEDIKLARRMLRRAAQNVRLLFELQADPDSGEFRLQNYGQAWMLADLLISANIVPRGYEFSRENKKVDPAKVVVGLMKTAEIKVSPISGLSNIMIVNNRPSVWGDLAQALVQRTGQVANFEAEEIGTKPGEGLELKDWPHDYGWRVSIWRKGQEKPYVGTYTVADARRAKLWLDPNRKPWITDPGRMLFNRARARPIHDGFADCLFGMGIIEEQLDFDAAPMGGGMAAIGGGAQAALPQPDAEPEPTAGIPGGNMAEYDDRAPEPVLAAEGENDTGGAASKLL